MVDSPVSPDAGTPAQEAPMYTPAHFSLTDSDSLHGLIRSHPLGTLCLLYTSDAADTPYV